MTLDIRGKWALVTGASRGVGQQIALGLAELGVNLVLHSSNKDNQSSTRSLLKDSGVQVHSVEGLLDNPAAINAFIQEAESLSDGIDILYNNAATMTAETPLFETPQSDYEKSFQINLYAVIQICGYFAPKMASRGWGRIINVSSGIRDQPNLNAYSITKAALDKYTRELAVELDGKDVLANMVDPGWCRTDMGGPDAFNDASTVLPGALIPAMLGKQGDQAPKGMMFAAQNFAGIKWQ